MTTAIAEPPMTVAEQLLKWDRYLRRLSTWWAKHCMLDRNEVEQEVWCHALAHAHRHDPARGGFSTWITLVVRNVAFKMARARQIHGGVKAVSLSKPMHDLDGYGTIGDIVCDTKTVDPADDAARREIINRVRDALESLPVVEQEAVRRRFWNDATMRRVNPDALETGLVTLADSLPFE